MFCFSVAAGMDAAKGTSKGMQPLSGDQARLPVRWAQRRARVYHTLPVREPKDVTTVTDAWRSPKAYRRRQKGSDVCWFRAVATFPFVSFPFGNLN
jgi:hypothetical protein